MLCLNNFWGTEKRDDFLLEPPSNVLLLNTCFLNLMVGVFLPQSTVVDITLVSYYLRYLQFDQFLYPLPIGTRSVLVYHRYYYPHQKFITPVASLFSIIFFYITQYYIIWCVNIIFVLLFSKLGVYFNTISTVIWSNRYFPS